MATMFNEQPDEKAEQDEVLPLHMTYLTPAMIEEARTELNETDEVRVEALEKFRKLINGERNLTTPTDDLFLLAFLRSRKFQVKRAFKLLQNYWTFRKKYRHIYDTTNVQSVCRLFMRNFTGLLWYRDRKGCTVVIVKFALWNPEQDTFEDLFRALTGALIHAAEFPATQISGYRAIFDIRGLTWTQTKYFTPSNLLLFIQSSQFCFPGRYKTFHIISDSKMVKFISTIVNPLLSSKLKKRIIIHNDSNLETIKEYIHPSVLPAEFGGEAPEFNSSKWTVIIEDLCHKVVEQLDYGYVQ